MIEITQQFHNILYNQIEQLQSKNKVIFVKDFNGLGEYEMNYIHVLKLKPPVKNVGKIEKLNNINENNCIYILCTLFIDNCEYVEFKKIENKSYDYEIVLHVIPNNSRKLQHKLNLISNYYLYGEQEIACFFYETEYKNDCSLLNKNSNIINKRQKYGKMFYDFLVKNIDPIQKNNKIALLHSNFMNHYIFSHGWKIKKNIRKFVTKQVNNEWLQIHCNLEKNDTTSFEFKDNKIIAYVEENCFNDIIISMKWASSLYMYNEKWEPDTHFLDKFGINSINVI